VSFLSTAGDRNRLRNVVAKWRPGRALFMGIWVLNSGRLWGWPTVKWGDAGLVWGGTFTFYSAALE
jgi:hypothetical protein